MRGEEAPLLPEAVQDYCRTEQVEPQRESAPWKKTGLCGTRKIKGKESGHPWPSEGLIPTPPWVINSSCSSPLPRMVPGLHNVALHTLLCVLHHPQVTSTPNAVLQTAACVGSVQEQFFFP